jgi:ribosomal protein S12
VCNNYIFAVIIKTKKKQPATERDGKQEIIYKKKRKIEIKKPNTGKKKTTSVNLIDQYLRYY